MKHYVRCLVPLYAGLERGIADAHLSADFFNRRAKLGLLQRERNLLLHILALLHVMTPSIRVKIMPETLLLIGTELVG